MRKNRIFKPAFWTKSPHNLNIFSWISLDKTKVMGLFSFIYIGGTVYPKITLQRNIKLKVIASYEVKLDLKWANNSNSNNKLQKCSLSFSVNKDKHILGTLMGHSSKKQTMKSPACL